MSVGTVQPRSRTGPWTGAVAFDTQGGGNTPVTRRTIQARCRHGGAAVTAPGKRAAPPERRRRALPTRNSTGAVVAEVEFHGDAIRSMQTPEDRLPVERFASLALRLSGDEYPATDFSLSRFFTNNDRPMSDDSGGPARVTADVDSEPEAVSGNPAAAASV